MLEYLMHLMERYYDAFFANGRYMAYIKGLGVTLEISFYAVIIGVLLGTFVAVIKYFAISHKSLKPLDMICNVYINIIRGTPVYVQLLLLNALILSVGGKQVAMITFGINSGAYVAEIIRAGLMSVDSGQYEAGTSLGLKDTVVMRFIILPQAIKNILPALGNEFITLVKETSIAGALAVNDLTKAAERVGGATLDLIPPLIGMAFIYFLIVIGLTKLLHMFERRLARSDYR
ncbi:MAG: amino acid ABC transporter permease [Oscillospiraceae bacterium]